MRIEVKGRNLPITAEMHAAVARRTERIARQVGPLATLEVLLEIERGGGKPDCHVTNATLRLKGTTLRSRKASADLRRSIALVTDDLDRQVKRHCEKKRGRRESRAAMEGARGEGAAEIELPELDAEPRPATV
jgi:putative sigma-54 modulation protein